MSSSHLFLLRPQRHAKDLARLPQPHGGPPRARAARHDNRHAVHVMPARKQRVDTLDEIPEGPDLPTWV